MAALLKLVGRLFRNTEHEKTDLNSMVAAVVEAETHDDVHDSGDDSDGVITEQNASEIENDFCRYQTGTITSIFDNYGLIDNCLYFDLANVSATNVRVGLKVQFLAYRRRLTDEWRVRKIMCIQDESWEEGVDQEEDTSEVRGAVTRVIVGQVVVRDKRNVTVSPDIVFSLNDVKAEFIPIEGDWVELEALVEVDRSVVDLSGEILTIDEVRPLRSRVFTGVVTHWDESDYGVVDRDVLFRKEVCDMDYVPCVQDQVAVQAIESTQGPYVWRALTVVPMFLPGETGRKKDTVEKRNVNELHTLLKNKNGIVITDHINFGVLQVGEVKELSIEVRNEGKIKKILYRGRFHTKRSESQMKLHSPGIDDYIILSSNRSVVYNFSCEGKNVGHSSELFVFTFKGFKIARYLEVEVQDPFICNLVPSKNTITILNTCDRYNKVRRMQDSSKKLFIVSGVKPVKPPAFVPVRLGMYPVPDRMWSAVLGTESDQIKKKDEVIESLRNIVPCLVADLTFGNYVDRFHALLHLEEINENLKMRRYDIDRTKFTFTGPCSEYLALEVPGLAEKRPSLLLGDKIIATDLEAENEEAGIQYEGYVHKVCCNEVWLKFNANFHLGYDDAEYCVSFHSSRTPLRRCHAAVNLALKHLGEYMLFPSSIKVQEAQLEFLENSRGVPNNSPPRRVTVAEKLSASLKPSLSLKDNLTTTPTMPKRTVKLQWFNTKLNYYQKEAVRNILKGEARPLPYIIFGPPGTGKTITLVEAILQILFLIPESRLMVATPSNSSANLLAERLLDSGLLCPGDIVRLVGYHCLEEGSLPERLLPYSTTGDIRLLRGEAACPMPLENRLETSSNANTLGRHRITVGTCIALGQLYTMGFPRGHFTHVLVDEAGQATEPEILIPLGFLHNSYGQAILAGDPKQLGPVVGSSFATMFGLGDSYLARLLLRFPYQRDVIGFPGKAGGYNPLLVTRLVMNYRSLPEILSVPSALFYHNNLESQVSEESSPEATLLASLSPILPERGGRGPPAIVFHGVRGTNYQDKDCPSWFNPQEIVQVLYYVKELFNHGLSADDIGVIAPYQKQVQKIRWLLEQLEIPIPKIGTVEEFQGQERKVVLLSAVRSTSNMVQSDIKHGLGFIASPHRLNVAITRARSLLIILGNPHLLSRDPYWRSVLKYCVDNDAYKGCDLPSSLHELPVDKDTDLFEETCDIANGNVFF